jgi:hypothetical protein
VGGVFLDIECIFSNMPATLKTLVFRVRGRTIQERLDTLIWQSNYILGPQRNEHSTSAIIWCQNEMYSLAEKHGIDPLIELDDGTSTGA